MSFASDPALESTETVLNETLLSARHSNQLLFTGLRAAQNSTASFFACRVSFRDCHTSDNFGQNRLPLRLSAPRAGT